MGYYIRVLAERDDNIPVSQIRAWLEAEGLNVVVTVEVGDEQSWNQITLKPKRGRELTSIERNPVEPDSLGEGELEEFAEELSDAKPSSAAEWLRNFLPGVKVIYAFQILSGGHDDYDWKPVHVVWQRIHGALGGIVQADDEGFSNREGHHILWQFSEDVTGSWTMAVLNEAGEWQPFEMDLGNPEHRAAFQAGQVPTGVRLLSK
jgi:hypothetical protein